MRVIVDAYGGDNAPLEIMKGTALAIKEYGVSAALCGRTEDLKELALKEDIPTDGMEFIEAQLSMPVEAEPAEIVKSYAESSMAVGFKALAAGGGDAFVTAGSTGAAVVGASLIVKRIKGIKRSALGVVMPTSTGCYLLIDAGANTECRPEMLLQFGIMGSVYMERIINCALPRVATINIGAEQTKGLELQIEANKLLAGTKLNFSGNIEARDLPLGGCDVAVTDGFTGNIVLKLTEGMGKMMSTEMKRMFLANFSTKIGALMLKSGIDAFRNRMDYTEYGGAPLMGISKPVIKAHGSSNAKAFKNAIRQAKEMHEKRVIPIIIESLTGLPSQE